MRKASGILAHHVNPGFPHVGETAIDLTARVEVEPNLSRAGSRNTSINLLTGLSEHQGSGRINHHGRDSTTDLSWAEIKQLW